MNKYTSLKIVAWVISFVGFLFLGVAIIEIAILVEISKNNTLNGNEFLVFARNLIDAFLLVNAGVIIFWGIVLFILFQAIAQQIKLFIDIERNTSVILENTNSQRDLLEQLLTITESQNGQMLCPRCMGKGHVDHNDIQRLSMAVDAFGPCNYCESTGSVLKGSPLVSDVTVQNSKGQMVIPKEAETTVDQVKQEFPSLFFGVISIAIFLYQLSVNYHFNWVFLLLGIGLLGYGYEKDPETAKQYELGLLGAGIFLILGIIFFTFSWFALILSLLLIGSAVFILYKK